jgi:hypothetical protein
LFSSFLILGISYPCKLGQIPSRALWMLFLKSFSDCVFFSSFFLSSHFVSFLFYFSFIFLCLSQGHQHIVHLETKSCRVHYYTTYNEWAQIAVKLPFGIRNLMLCTSAMNKSKETIVKFVPWFLQPMWVLIKAVA